METSNLNRKINKIRMVLLDVDGVLTDGSLILGDGEYKVFYVQDGLGIRLLKKFGIKVGFITGRRSEAVQRRAKELNIDFLYQGVQNKQDCLHQLVSESNLNLDTICYMGDDFTDLSVLKSVGFSVSVPNGRDEIKEVVDCVTENCGGKGAVRELAELILKTQGKWEKIISQFE